MLARGRCPPHAIAPDTQLKPKRISMHTDVVNEVNVCSAPLPPASDLHEQSFYETCCGLCGAQIHFRKALTDWTKVYCPGCGEYVAVR